MTVVVGSWPQVGAMNMKIIPGHEYGTMSSLLMVLIGNPWWFESTRDYVSME
jgi:hypothetical protein